MVHLMPWLLEPIHLARQAGYIPRMATHDSHPNDNLNSLQMLDTYCTIP